MNKRGQLDISFGMIFSIILIIIFIAAGFYAITKIIEFQKSVQIQNFLRDFQGDVTKMWGSTQGSQDLIYSLPTNVNAICFRDDEFQNLEFNSKGIIPGKMIEHIDIAKTTKDESPLCMQNVKGKISLTIVKDYGEALVTVER
jgi:hypothetical protein